MLTAHKTTIPVLTTRLATDSSDLIATDAASRVQTLNYIFDPSMDISDASRRAAAEAFKTGMNKYLETIEDQKGPDLALKTAQVILGEIVERYRVYRKSNGSMDSFPRKFVNMMLRWRKEKKSSPDRSGVRMTRNLPHEIVVPR